MKELLNQLVNIRAPSGSEYRMKDFLLQYVEANSAHWKVVPEAVHGDCLLDNLILVFGKPRTAIFAHMDSTGFMVGYQDRLVSIGGPDAKSGHILVGEDHLGPVRCELQVDENSSLSYGFGRAIGRGTTLTWEPSLKMGGDYVEGTYMDNRLGIYNALQVAETLENGAIVFSSYEEQGGGSVPMLTKYLAENFNIRQALISDVTWVTEGVRHGEGVAISMRDHNIPRRVFLDKVIHLANKSGIPYQLEVEGEGSSDGREVHFSPYPIDWLFVGPPEDHVHAPNEKVHLDDLSSTISMYRYLMEKL